jgi:hypothetical protein
MLWSLHLFVPRPRYLGSCTSKHSMYMVFLDGSTSENSQRKSRRMGGLMLVVSRRWTCLCTGTDVGGRRTVEWRDRILEEENFEWSEFE